MTRPRLYVLDLGRMRMDKSLLIAHWQLASRSNPNPPAEFVELPISAYLVDHPDGRVLYDTGCHPDSMGPGGRWPQAYQDYFPYIGGEECQLPHRLAELGFDPDEIRYVVLSHMHSDHAGCVEFFRKSQIIVHEDEMAGALRRHEARDKASGYCWKDIDQWLRLDLHWRKIGCDEGDLGLVDGVSLLNWGSGHAYGMLGLKVDLASEGGVILTSDSIYCAENYGPPMRPQGVVYDSLGYARTVERVRQLAAATRSQVWFGHDARQFARLRTSTEGWYE
jgi:N-acyl homoserine lactone hydrolase